jgi:hypothetical protein
MSKATEGTYNDLVSCPRCGSVPRFVRLADQVGLACRCTTTNGFLPSEARAINEWNRLAQRAAIEKASGTE